MAISFSLKANLSAWCLLLGMAVATVSCSKNDDINEVNNPPATDTAATYLNQAYGTDAQQTMDIYLPPGRSQAATHCLIFIHGGAWTFGDKSEFTATIDSLRRLNTPYACFNINYRLAQAGKNQYPAAENDVQSALDYISKNRERFGVSASWILLGTSAGAHLSVLQAYKHNNGNIKGVVSLYGVYDLTKLFDQTETAVQVILTNVMGGIPAVKPQAYYDASPINYVTPQSVPVLVMYGTQDPIAPPAQATAFIEKLKTQGVTYEQISYPSEHGIPPAYAADAWGKAFAFINKYLPAG